MLLELKIRNLAILESVDIRFGQGLNVFTGETGAGKSMILAALDLVLGGRGDRTVIRTGEQEAWAEAVFDMTDKASGLVKEWGIPVSDGEPLAIRRIINANGRSRAYLNCALLSVNLLRQLAPLLLDFGRQHEQSSLLNPEKHLEILDRYAHVESERKGVEEAHHQVLALVREHNTLQSQTQARAERSEFLHFQRQSIKSVDPQPGEEQALLQEQEQLATSEKRRKIAQRAEHALYSAEDSVQEQLASAISMVKELAELDNTVEHVYQDLQNALIAVEEAGNSMQVYQKSVRLDPERMSEVQQRLDQVIKLQQKYGGNFSSVAKKLQEIDNELATLAAQDRRLKELDKLIVTAKVALVKLVKPLSEKRVQSAQILAERVEKQLFDLAMPKARFKVDFSAINDNNEGSSVMWVDETGHAHAIAPWGMENAHFLLSANAGEELRSLERVASGGELSRIMLALKDVLASAFAIPTIVFDEIDAGVAGAAAATVAQKLRSIVSQTDSASQIICISHTPQVAAEADHHFHVEKQTRDGRTSTQVITLTKEQRILELSRMLAGNQSPEQSRALAEELVKNKG